jgi:hypothetical protein
MKIISINYPKQQEDQDKLNRLIQTYDSVQAPTITREVEIKGYTALSNGKQFEAAFGVQFRQLWKRVTIFVRREPVCFLTRMVNGVFNGLLISMAYWQVNGDSQQDINNISGSMFILLTNIMCNTLFGTLQIFQFERPVFLREQSNQMYSFVPYFLTKNLHEQPLIVAQPLLTLTMMFWAVGYYPSVQTFFGMYLALYMFSQCGVSLGFFISTISPDIQVGIAISMPILLLFVLFGGFAVNT